MAVHAYIDTWFVDADADADADAVPVDDGALAGESTGEEGIGAEEEGTGDAASEDDAAE